MGNNTYMKWVVFTMIFSLILIILYDTRSNTSLSENPSTFSFLMEARKQNLSSSQKQANETIETMSKPISIITDSNFSRQCFQLYNGSANDIALQNAIKVKTHRYSLSQEHKTSWISNTSLKCEDYFAYHGHFNTRRPLNYAEDNFPIAFGILIYHEVDQFEQLFRAIYRPQNFYCVHVDDSADRIFKDKVKSLINCFPSNVFVVPTPIDVAWGKPSLLRAELECMKLLLLLSGKWKYYINLTGEEFPLMTNMELVSVLSRLKGSNLVEGGSKIHLNRYPETLPGGLQKFKSSTHVALCREAVHYIITNKTISHSLLIALAPYPINDESFFGTLQFNNFSLTGFPGGAKNINKGRGYVRYKRWNRKCPSGLQKRSICIVGVKDLPKLVSEIYGKYLAVNKFFWWFEPMAWDCLQVWHYRKIEDEYKTGKIAFDPDLFIKKYYFSD